MATKLRLFTNSDKSVMIRMVMTEITVVGTESKLAMTVENPRSLRDNWR